MSASRRLWLRAWLRNTANARSMSTASRSASTPLACSITMRLFSARFSLPVDDLGLRRGALLQDGDGREVGERLGRVDVCLQHVACVGVEHVERADHGAPQAHR